MALAAALYGGGGGGAALITWNDAPGPYNVYRGSRTSGWSYDQTCFAPDVPGAVTDAAPPDPGQMLYYLVSRRSACGESIIGRDSYGVPDPNTHPCP